MAASVVTPQPPRTGSAKWGRPRSVHVPHPMAARSLDIDLTVTGTPTPGLERASSRILLWPPPSETFDKQGRPLKSRALKSTVWRTDDELVAQVKQKLSYGMDGVRQMFRAKDPHGDSIVSREGLYQIVTALVGHVSREQYDSFLKTICLHWRSSISFDEFIVRFSENPAVAKFCMSESSRRAQLQEPAHIEENLRSTSMLEWCPFTSAPYAFVVFRKKLQKGEVNIRDLLPPACFHSDGRVIQPQLRDALAQLGIRLTDKEFYNIWQKFDADYNGSVPIKRFYKALDLSPNGLPIGDHRASKSAHAASRKAQVKESKSIRRECKSQMQVTSSSQRNTAMSMSKVDTVEICGDKANIIGENFDGGPRSVKSVHSQQRLRSELTKRTEEVETTTTTTRQTVTTTTEKKEEQLVDDAKLTAHVQSLIQQRRNPPKFESVQDHLHFKFEETYRSLVSAFRLFDFMNDGYVARIDFRRVLNEFGFDVTAIDLDAFLYSAGIPVVQGLINYYQFLQKFQSKSETSIASHLIAKNSESVTHNYRHIETAETLRAEEMESRVSNFFQTDYLKLLNLCKQKDKNRTGTIPAYELRHAVNSVLKINMTDRQFEELVTRLSQTADDGSTQINYNNFLEQFNANPGQWNKKGTGLLCGKKYHLGEIPPASPVLRLQEKAKTWMAPSAEKVAKTNSLVAKIKQKLTRLFSNRFHVFDKHFQEMDKKRTGHMSKWQFGALIKLCGITLSIHDLDHFWASLDIAADNTLSYVTLVKTFCPGQLNNIQPAVKAIKGKLSKSGTPLKTLQQQVQHIELNIEEPPHQPRFITGSSKERKVVQLIEKIKDDVLKRCDVLQSVFLNLDRDGYSSVAVKDMQEICLKMKFQLTDKERDELINSFDVNANGWFNYINFLEAIKKQEPGSEVSPFVFDIHTKRLHRKAGPTSMAITLFDFLTELKGILLKKHKTLRGAFKFFDHNRNGFIEEDELKKSMSMLGYNLSEQDFLDIFQVFDKSQAMQLSYEDFKSTLLTT